MQVTLYKCSSPKMDGEIVLTYHDGWLYNILMRLNQSLSIEQWNHFIEYLPYAEMTIKKLGFGALVVQPLEDTPVNKKIALFCDYYMRFVKGADHQPLKYKVSPADAGKIKHVNVDDRLLTVYFGSPNFLFKNKYSIANYVKYYNELCAEAAGATQQKYPNRYDRDFEKKLQGKEVSDYWAHLRSLGLKPVTNKIGTLIDFK